MKRIGICGHFGNGNDATDGQTVKTQIFYRKLAEILGEDSVAYINTYNWTHHPLKLFFGSLGLFRTCKNLIIMPAYRGVRVFIPLYLFLNKFYKRKILYVVIGGWLADMLQEKPSLLSGAKKLDGIYVENESFKEELAGLGLTNLYIMRNPKDLTILKEPNMDYQKQPLRVMTFSRIIKGKGIDKAVNAVQNANKKLGRTAYTLDIIGDTHPAFEDWFKEIQKTFTSEIKYLGPKPYRDAHNFMPEYFALLLPTLYFGEGTPGSIPDAFASGLPTIATKWKHGPSVIEDGVDGIFIDFDRPEEALTEKLIELANQPESLNEMRKNCLKSAQKYSAENIVREFITTLEDDK